MPSSNSSSSLTAASGRPDDAGDAVADLEDAADLRDRDVGLEALEVLAQRAVMSSVLMVSSAMASFLS